jgi:hypothetical protein
MAARKSSRRKGGAKSSARKGGAKKASRGAKKSSARKKSAKRGGAKKSTSRRPAKSAARRKPAKRSAPKRKSPMQRVTSVAKQVAQQAQAAVVGGVDALREMGGNVADRVAERVGGSEQG